jgi:hypothetical protein
MTVDRVLDSVFGFPRQLTSPCCFHWVVRGDSLFFNASLDYVPLPLLLTAIVQSKQRGDDEARAHRLD